MQRVDDFLKTEKAHSLGFYERPDFYETAALLFLAQYDPEVKKAVGVYTALDEETLRRIARRREAINKSLRPKNQSDDDHDTEQS